MKKPWYDSPLFYLGITLALVLIVLTLVTGITNLVTFLSIMFVLVGGLYTGMNIERRRIKNER